MGLVSSNPCDLVERPRQSPAPARGYSADEVRRILEVVPDTIQGRRDRAILLVFILTGRRRSEVMDLKASDISIEDSTVFYSYRGKGGKRGRRELPRPAWEAIRTDARRTAARRSRRWTRASRSGRQALARRDSRGPRSTPASVGTSWLPDCSRPGCTSCAISAAKLRRDAGESVETVSAFLDHSSLAVRPPLPAAARGGRGPLMGAGGRRDRSLRAE